jgi:hypothetical protein
MPSKLPPAPNYRWLQVILFLHLIITLTHVHAIAHNHLPVNSLCALPVVFFCGSSTIYFHRCREVRAIHNLLTPTPCDPSSFYKHLCFDSFATSSNAEKLSMLSAWQTTTSKAPTIISWEQDNLH